MGKVLVDEQYLDDIANAIRLKNGEYNQYYPSEMASAIMRITASEGVKFLSMVDINDGWKFNLVSQTANPSYSSTAEAKPYYDDSEWRDVSLPHDWSIELNFNSSAGGGDYRGGFLNGGDAWYRKSLSNMPYLNGKQLILYFDGIYMESDVYVNGILRKSARNWYSPFWLDITDYVNINSDNTIAVFVRNRQPSTHWYSGSGIYRKVYLLVCEPASVAIKDIVITTPNLTEEVGGDVTTEAKINIVSSVSATLPLKVEIIRDNEVLSYEETSISVTVGNNQTVIDVLVNDPDLWDIGAGNLYTAKVTIGNGSSAISHSVSFGYRYFEFKAATGFWLNGNNIKLKGVSIHDTYGCVGAKANRSAIDRELDTLVEMGCNSIRTAHNAYSTEIMTLCAEKGIIVYEEFFDCWTHAKITYDFARYFSANYQEVISNVIRRDINNPAVVLWSAGNEIIGGVANQNYYTQQEAVGILQDIIDTIHALDVTRPISMSDDTPSSTVSRACFALLDVIGVNYGSDSEYTSLISAFPDKPIFGSETTSAYMIRGDYADTESSNYDNKHAIFGDTISDALHRHMDNAKLAGMYPWCGVDYLGEGAPYRVYPQRSCADGALDTALFKKDAFYLYQSVWSNVPMVHIVPSHWDWTNNETVTVWLYSNCASVKLYLNGADLGSVQRGSKYQFAYSVTFARGTLVANGYDSGGNLVAQDVLFTSCRNPYKLSLTADKVSVNKNSDDLVFVTCDIVDKNDVIVPAANNTIAFSVTGGTVIGTDSGWIKDIELMTGSMKKASFGKLLCVVKPDKTFGDLVITAASDHLISGTTTVRKTSATIKRPEPTSEFIDASDPPIKDYSEYPIYQIGTRLYINDGANITVSQSGTRLVIRG